MKREQPRKDSNTKRVNFDNESKKKFDKDYEPRRNNSKKKQNKKANNQRKQGKTNQDVETGAKRPTANDANWYAKSPTLLTAAGSLPFATIAGTPVLPGKQSVPGIMTFQYVHNYNMADEANAMRQAFDSQYSFLVHANSRNYTYDAIDLGVMECAGFEVFSMIAHMARAYGIARYYEEENLYNGKYLLEAMGFDADNFYKNLGQIWFDINLLIDQSRQIWVPNTMPLLARWIWMNSTVFTDGEGKRAQYYLYVPRCFYKFADHVGSKVGSTLITVENPTFLDYVGYNTMPFGVANTPAMNKQVWTSWMAAARDMIKALVNSQDRGIIYGDILNAYGSDKIFAFPPIPADYKIAPVYNAEVLTQFENATMCQGYYPLAYMQTKGKFLSPIFTDYTTSASQASMFWGERQTPKNPIINFHYSEQPKPENIMVATRMMMCGGNGVPNSPVGSLADVTGTTATFATKKFVPIPSECGSEICTDMIVYRYDAANNQIKASPLNYGQHSGNTASERYELIGKWAWNAIPFDWSPMYYSMKTTTTSSPTNGVQETEDCNILSEFDNYIVTDQWELKKLHQVAIFSLLDVPAI